MFRLRCCFLIPVSEYKGGHLEISASALRKFYFYLTKCFMKNKTFMWNVRKCSFLHLVMRHQYPAVTITHFPTISYHISTKIPSKTSMVESFIGTFPGHGTCFCRNGSTGDFISGVLKTARLCSLQACIVTN